MSQDDIEFSSEGLQEIENLMREGSRIAGSTSDFSAALARFTAAFPSLAPHTGALLTAEDADAQRSFCMMLFREIWKHLPRPDHGFRPLPLPKLERNNPCACGSGRKYKQCCARMEGELPSELQGMSLLRYVLEDLPTSAYEKLPFNHLSPEEIAFVAEHWVENGRAEAATFLLVPLLIDLKKLDARHEPAFDVLGDAYLKLGMPDERLNLVERVMTASDPTLRSGAMQRRCTMYSDAGDWPAAWKLFAKAERLQPDNVALSHLETIMLASEGRTDEAQERARYWLAKLTRMGYESEHSGLIDFLRMMGENPVGVLAMIRGEMDVDEFDEGDGYDNYDGLVAVLDLLDDLPEPACHYKLHVAEGNAGGLEAEPALAALERDWQSLFDDESGDGDPWEDAQWIDWLGDNPLAWQSFVILEAVDSFLDEKPMPEGLEEALFSAVIQLRERAKRLLEEVIAHNGAENCRLEWGWLENRPALRLLEKHIDIIDDPVEELRMLEWLVGTLNPRDNQGLRDALARALIENGRAADALALCDRYPQDAMAAMIYARVLALHQLDRLDDASAALASARKERPKVLDTLLAADPPMPELYFDAITVGGDDEAWYYRIDWLELWAKTGALSWLEQQAAR
jgi:tetratricopeptide (TPR) repeat protein